MAWASQYSTKQYKFIKIGYTSHTTLNSASFAPNEGEYAVDQLTLHNITWKTNVFNLYRLLEVDQGILDLAAKNELGSDGVGDGISMIDVGIMLSAFGYSNFVKTELLKWGMKGVNWGKAGANYLNFHLKAGKIAGYAGTSIYGYKSIHSFSDGENLQGLSNGLMTMYSSIATKGEAPGTVITLPFFLIDWTVGMDQFLLNNINYGIEQSNQIQNGNWSTALWRPGQALR